MNILEWFLWCQAKRLLEIEETAPDDLSMSDNLHWAIRAIAKFNEVAN